MPAVFVHGVPDTHRVWRALVCRLRRDDVVALSLPGFGCGIPAGFDCTKEAYCDWLLSELRRVEGPIDLVGHDWYEWHKAAKLWQTPGVGEQVMEQLTPEALASALVAAGVPQADAMSAAEHLDPTMKRSILALYRSAVRAGSEWEGDLQLERPDDVAKQLEGHWS